MVRASVLWAGLAAGLAVASAGCKNSPAEKVQGRSQIGGDDPAADPDAYATVGSKTIPDNMGPVAVSGVGLVYRLAPGAGSQAPPGGWRQMLETGLKKQGWTHIREILDDPNKTTSLVLVSAVIPPGARKNQPIDLEIAVPDDSKTSSLRGGILMPCELVEYDTTSNLSSIAKKGAAAAPGGSLVLGSVWAKTVEKAPVIAGTYEPPGRAAPAAEGEEPTLKAGKVWAGGRVTQNRPYFFIMKPGDDNIRMAAEVAERLNATFHGGDDPTRKVAEAKRPELVVVNVPYAYRNNHHRFLLVARQVPIVPVAAGSPYRTKLEESLLDPATCLTAAVKLEALGGDSRRALRVGLESPSPWVRFAAAEALTYLGHTDGAAVLAKTVEEHPALRAYALKALAVMDDAACTDRLVDLMGSADPVVRYGAFIALRLADENHPAARGVLANDSFWVHRVAPGTPGLVHLVTGRRSEVVVFGDGVKLRGPFTLPIGSEYTVSVPANGPEAKVSRIVRVKGQPEVKEVVCPADLSAVLATVARLGGGYGEAVELIRRADTAQVLTAAVTVNAIPQLFSVQQLAGYARTDPTLVKADVEVMRGGTAGTDLESTAVDLPADPSEARTPDTTPRAPLSRDPGRLFGPRQPTPPAQADGLSPVVPVGGTDPAPAAPLTTPTTPATAPRGQNPGTLFRR
ncbi:MAG TPA: HEAT repeat domain-containing protein [Urbifossiella sp.]|jgi:hypothetical protein|nr:HEAT repeat domain-containing protein [Urbifossiella sp.]